MVPSALIHTYPHLSAPASSGKAALKEEVDDDDDDDDEYEASHSPVARKWSVAFHRAFTLLGTQPAVIVPQVWGWEDRTAGVGLGGSHCRCGWGEEEINQHSSPIGYRRPGQDPSLLLGRRLAAPFPFTPPSPPPHSHLTLTHALS